MNKLSDEYLKQLSHLHKTTMFGSGGTRIPSEIKSYLSQVDSLLDFGCGKGFFSETVKNEYPQIELYSYDPVTSPIPLPEKVDMIYSSDVLEHIEPQYIDETLDMLFNIGVKYQYHLIACHPAKKKLNDGRNAHLIIETPDWWKSKLSKYKWSTQYETITEKYIEKFNLNVIKYITILKNDNT